jgi:hypothetical protein
MTGKNPLWAAEQSGYSVEVMLRMYAKWPASPMNLPPDLPPHCHQRMTVVTNGALSGCPRGKSGGEGGIRTLRPILEDQQCYRSYKALLSPAIPLDPRISHRICHQHS